MRVKGEYVAQHPPLPLSLPPETVFLLSAKVLLLLEYNRLHTGVYQCSSYSHPLAPKFPNRAHTVIGNFSDKLSFKRQPKHKTKAPHCIPGGSSFRYSFHYMSFGRSRQLCAREGLREGQAMTSVAALLRCPFGPFGSWSAVFCCCCCVSSLAFRLIVTSLMRHCCVVTIVGRITSVFIGCQCLTSKCWLCRINWGRFL